MAFHLFYIFAYKSRQCTTWGKDQPKPHMPASQLTILLLVSALISLSLSLSPFLLLFLVFKLLFFLCIIFHLKVFPLLGYLGFVLVLLTSNVGFFSPSCPSLFSLSLLLSPLFGFQNFLFYVLFAILSSPFSVFFFFSW